MNFIISFVFIINRYYYHFCSWAINIHVVFLYCLPFASGPGGGACTHENDMPP